MALNLDPAEIVKTRVLANFTSLLRNFLPRGPLWKFLGETWETFLESKAVELDREDQRIVDLQNESIPGLSTEGELLEDWERIALLPDENTGGTEAERQAIVHTKIFQTNKPPTEQFFTDYAANLNITITSFGTIERFRVGTGRVGDRLWDGNATAFTWIVNYTGGTAEERAAMKAAFERLAPAHTTVEFDPAIP